MPKPKRYPDNWQEIALSGERKRGVALCLRAINNASDPANKAA
jgi:hypothetical protein